MDQLGPLVWAVFARSMLVRPPFGWSLGVYASYKHQFLIKSSDKQHMSDRKIIPAIKKIRSILGNYGLVMP